MPKTDWQALDARIAREVMKWVKWEELSADNRQFVAIYNRRTWLRLDESGCPHSTDLLYKDWQPHKNVAQALQAADRICDQGWDREVTRLGSAQKRYASFWQYRPIGRDTFDGCADIDAKATCLAIEAWLDAQRLPDGEVIQ